MFTPIPILRGFYYVILNTWKMEIEVLLVGSLLLVLGFVIYQQSEHAKKIMNLLDRNTRAIEEHTKAAKLQHETFQAIIDHVIKVK